MNMKFRKMSAVLLIAVMLFCALPMGAAAASHDHSSYTPIDAIDPAVPLTPGYYVLTQDVDVKDGDEITDWTLYNDMVLDLNGFKLNYKKLTVNTTNFVLQNCGSTVQIGPMEIKKGGTILDGNITVSKGSEAAAIVVSTGKSNEGVMLNPENGGTVSVDGISSNGWVVLDYASSCGDLKATGANFFLTIFDDYSGSAPIAFTPCGEGFFCALSKTGDVEDFIALESDDYVIEEEEDALEGVRDLSLVKKPLLKIMANAHGTCGGTIGASNGVSSCLAGESIPYTETDTITLSATPDRNSIFVGWEFPDAPGTYYTNSVYSGSVFGETGATVTAHFAPKLAVEDVLTQVGKEAEFKTTEPSFTKQTWTPASGAPEGSGTNTYTIPAAKITAPGTFTYTLDADCAEFTSDFTYDYAPVEFKLYVNGVTNESALTKEFELGGTIAPDAAVQFGTPAFTYSKDGSSWSDTAPDAPGAWKVKVTVTEDADGKIPALEYIYDITVKLPQPTVSADPEKVTLSSGSGSAKLTAECSVSGVSYQWKKDGTEISGATSAELDETYAAADAGEHEYVCVITLSGESAESEPVTVTVMQANTIGEVQIANWVYGETPSTPALTAAPAFGTAVYTYSDAADGTYSSTVPTNAGTYYVKASVAETATYAAVESAPAEFKILKADQDYPKDLEVKNETVMTLCDGAIGNVTTAMEYKRSDESAWKDCPNGTIADLAPGTYMVRFKATDNLNAGDEAVVTVLPGGGIPDTAKYRFRYSPLKTLPAELADFYATLADLQSDMLAKVKANKMGGKSYTGYQIWDIVLEFSVDEGRSWHVVTGSLFPTQGIQITLPYPEGTSASSTKFYAAHVFTFADKRGTYEYPDVTTGSTGVSMTLTGTSPLVLAYIAPNGNGGNNTGNGGTGAAVPTGDANNPLLWGTLLGLSTLGLGAAVIMPKLKKKNQEKNS